MTSPRQSAANRRNAQRSTGPRTAAGRKLSAMNALKHGLRARTVLLDCEDEDEFRVARDMFLADLEPRGFLEEALADNVVSAWWQLKRAQGVEATVLDLELVVGAQARNQRQQAELAQRLGHEHLEAWETAVPRLEPHMEAKLTALLGDEDDAEAQAFNDLVAQERALDLLRDGLEQQPGHAFARDATGADVLAKLSRYLTAAQRRFHAALREFERVQDRRGERARRADSDAPSHLTPDSRSPVRQPGRPPPRRQARKPRGPGIDDGAGSHRPGPPTLESSNAKCYRRALRSGLFCQPDRSRGKGTPNELDRNNPLCQGHRAPVEAL